MPSYREYFEAEMRSLQELAQEFADAYPEQAAMLNLNSIKDRDPYVERLLEGMAFLTSQIRHRIDDSIPEISENLLDQIMPSMVRPYPSTSIVQFEPNVQNTEMTEVEEGLPVKALDMGPLGANCCFTTCYPVYVQPISLVDVKYEEKSGGGCFLKLSFQKSARVAWDDIDLSKLKLYLNTDWPLAYSLFHVFTDSQTKVSVVDESAKPLQSSELLSFVAAHQSASHHILPSNGRSRLAFSLMHDYFCAREKYLFVEPRSFECLSVAESSNTITVCLNSSVSLPADAELSVDHIQLHCTPALNLYPEEGKPIFMDHSRSEYRVTADSHVAQYSAVYNILEVKSRDQATGQTYQYHPIHAMRHRSQEDRVYSTTHRTAGVDSRVSYLKLRSLPPFSAETVSLQLLVTNEQYPRRYVDIGAVDKAPEDLTRKLSVKNLTRPTKMLHAPAFHDFQWQLISLLSLNFSSLESVDHLKHILALFDWSDLPENQRKIEAISAIKIKTIHQLKRGVLLQGLDVRVELSLSGFSSVSDMYLFGSVLHQFFSAFANMTEFVQTRVVQLPSYKEWTWSPVFGNKALF